MARNTDGAAEPGVNEESQVTAALFPAGTGALFKAGPGGRRVPMGPDEVVTLVNVSLSEVHLRTINDTIKNPKGHEEKTVAIKPFGSINLTVAYARKVLQTQEKPGGDPKMVVAPTDGDCGGNHNFKGYGKTFVTCPYANCKTHGPLPAAVKWSVFQAQHRISMLWTEPAIRRIIESIDNRTPVVMWGLEVITQRVKAKQERMGLVGVVNPADVTF